MRVLVVEDSPPTRELLMHSLEKAGYSVAVASRFSTGIKLAAEEPFDILLIDVMLPDGDGFEMCRELRRTGVETPILFLTAKGEVDARVTGLDAGGDDYLRKPFALAELHARVRALTRRRGRAGPQVFRAGATKIDFSGRRMVIGDQDIPMTAREWAVLEILVGQQGRVAAREDLLDLCWQGAGARASGSLDVIVSRLRRKLASPGGGTTIRTIRGKGYVFEVDA